jgi:hypothetical protein
VVSTWHFLGEMITIIVALIILYVIITFTKQQEPSQDQVESILQLFPNISREVIEQDLRTTRSVQETCERILQGLVGGGDTAAAIPTPNDNSISTTTNNSIQKLAMKTLDKEPVKEWFDSKQDRQSNLQRRKLKMLLESRKKFLELS